MADPGRARRLIIPTVTAAWVAYSSWVLALVLPTDVNNARAWVSELGAAGQPFHLVYRLGDRISGVLLVLTGVVVMLAARRVVAGRRWWRLLGWCYVMGGVALEIEAFSPLPCAPSLDEACKDRLLSTHPTLIEDFHAAASFVETTALLSALALTWWMIRARGRLAWNVLAALVVLSAVGETMSGLGLWFFTGAVQRAALGDLSICGIWGMVWLIRLTARREAAAPASTTA